MSNLWVVTARPVNHFKDCDSWLGGTHVPANATRECPGHHLSIHNVHLQESLWCTQGALRRAHHYNKPLHLSGGPMARHPQHRSLRSSRDSCLDSFGSCNPRLSAEPDGDDGDVITAIFLGKLVRSRAVNMARHGDEKLV